MALVMFGVVLAEVGCGVTLAPTPKGAIVGRPGLYDYSPSVIQSGDVQQFWWCGLTANPSDSSQTSDTILYESINATSHVTFGPVPVLGESPGAWDSIFTCNPKVIQGVFSNPLGDGQIYSYAMYYVGFGGTVNNIGVAFSKDGISWKKYPKPIITPISEIGYGVGQPALYNSDRKAGIWMFYEESNSTVYHIEATSTDGIHFTVQGTLTTNGLDPNNPQPTWGDMAYDPTTGYWYAGFNLPLRDPATTGDVGERGQYGIQLYRIPSSSLLTGTTPWQLLWTVDTNLTGQESNFIPSFLSDGYGNLNVGEYPTIQMYTSMSNPQPAWNASPAAAGRAGDTSNWDIGSAAWVPSNQLVAFNQYFNNKVHEATTGWIDPKGGFTLESTVGHLYQGPQQGANVPFYGCKDGSTDYFVSLDHLCEGARILGVNGYGYAQPVAGINLVALYRCTTDTDHFVSQDPTCAGQAAGLLLGYILP